MQVEAVEVHVEGQGEEMGAERVKVTEILIGNHVKGSKNMPKGIPISGVNKGWFRKGESRFPEYQIKKGQRLSPLTEFKKEDIPKNAIKKGEHIGQKTEFKNGQTVGEKSNNWKGGITSVNDKIRKSNEYIEWRRIVYVKDEYTCQMCGQKHVDIVAHHIKSFSDYPDLRFVPSNGNVLCRSCHLKLHRRNKNERKRRTKTI